MYPPGMYNAPVDTVCHHLRPLQVYMTVCFEKHNVTVVAADAMPITPQTFSQCVDVNAGQRCARLATCSGIDLL